ncbi:hypothetical protein BpHYR1_042159 [Brachionus plicatilis]|uniref:Uncharacterized protein n=1 Tax=Brachionus plicatilis TaxID=10195 RepID=A0A3M7QF95_BRAPC|nr:hypothetical protein BpHYR1_042159 [Brachionus plicatilis]
MIKVLTRFDTECDFYYLFLPFFIKYGLVKPNLVVPIQTISDKRSYKTPFLNTSFLENENPSHRFGVNYGLVQLK